MKQKRHTLNILQKKEIIDFSFSDNNMSQQELSDFFSKKFNVLIPRRTISNIIKSSEKVFKNFLDNKGQIKRSRNLKFASLEKELKEWFSYMKIKNFIITEDITKTKALQICKT